MNQEELRKEAARNTCIIPRRPLAFEYTNLQVYELEIKTFVQGAEWEAEREKWDQESIDENNSDVYNNNIDELEGCFDEGLACDGGQHWVCGHKIIEALTANGYVITKTSKQ